MRKFVTGLLIMSQVVVPFSSFANEQDRANCSATPNEISIRSIPESEIFGDWKIVNYLGQTSRPISKKDMANSELVKSAIMSALAKIPVASLIPAAESAYRAYCVDVNAIGGVYTKSYYVRKIVDPSTSSANVPVPYEFKYMTVFYNSPDMRPQNVVYIQNEHDGIRLATNR